MKTTDHGAILRMIRTIEELQPTNYVLSMRHLETLSEHWGARWYLYSVVICGTQYWPVLSEARHEMVRGLAGWDLVTTRLGKGEDE